MTSCANIQHSNEPAMFFLFFSLQNARNNQTAVWHQLPKTIFAFVTAQNSRKIQQRDCRAYFRQFCACNGNALHHSDIHLPIYRVCNKNAAKMALYSPKKALWGAKIHIFWCPKTYILRPNYIYIGTSLHIYSITTPYILARSQRQTPLPRHRCAPE